MAPEHTPLAVLDTDLFGRGCKRRKPKYSGSECGGLGQAVINGRGSGRPVSCNTVVSLCFLGVTFVMEQLLILLLGTSSEFPVQGGWRDNPRRGDMDQDKCKMLFKALVFFLAHD